MKKAPKALFSFQVKVMVNEYVEERNINRITFNDIIKAIAPKATSAIPEDNRQILINDTINVIAKEKGMIKEQY